MKLIQYLLFVGTAHDAPLRARVAARARQQGFQVDDEDGPFGTVVVTASEDSHTQLRAIEEVTAISTVPTEDEIEQSIRSLELMLAQRRKA